MYANQHQHLGSNYNGMLEAGIMDIYLCDQLIGILKEIKETNHTMEMDNPHENPDFEKNWFRPAERQHYHLVDKFIETIKKNVDGLN